nr:putative protein [Streptomyces sp. FXJ7.023]
MFGLRQLDFREHLVATGPDDGRTGEGRAGFGGVAGDERAAPGGVAEVHGRRAGHRSELNALASGKKKLAEPPACGRQTGRTATLGARRNVDTQFSKYSGFSGFLQSSDCSDCSVEAVTSNGPLGTACCSAAPGC